VKITDALWEKRNLGVSCTELVIEARDDLEDVRSAVEGLPQGYHVIKVPVGRYDLMSQLEQVGFSFIEGSIRVRHDLDVRRPAGLFKRMIDASSTRTIELDEIERVADEIRAGLFTTDRVFLDPHFTAVQAAGRYVNWMHDELARGGSVHELSMSGRGVGFFVFRQDDEGVGYSILSGLYEVARSPGLGSVLLHTILAEAVRRRLRLVSSYISTNNLPVIKTHIDQGFTIVDLHYVYVRMATASA
jgi:ribosomal protein S18 acetylase RimI-like enzyme